MASEAEIRAGGASVEITAAQAGISAQASERKFLDEISTFGKQASFLVERAMSPVTREFARSADETAKSYTETLLERLNTSLGRFSFAGRLTKAFHGTGPILALTLGAREVAAISEGLVKADVEMQVFRKDTSAVFDEWVRAVPILGSVYKTLYNIVDATKGLSVETARANQQFSFTTQVGEKLRQTMGEAFPAIGIQNKINEGYIVEAMGYDDGGRQLTKQPRDARRVLNDLKMDIAQTQGELARRNKSYLPDFLAGNFRFTTSLFTDDFHTTDDLKKRLQFLNSEIPAAMHAVTRGDIAAAHLQPMTAAGTFNPFTVSGLGAGNSVVDDVKAIRQDIAALVQRSFVSGQPNIFTH